MQSGGQLGAVLIFLSSPNRPDEAGLYVSTASMSGRPSTKSFSDLNKIWLLVETVEWCTMVCHMTLSKVGHETKP